MMHDDGEAGRPAPDSQPSAGRGRLHRLLESGSGVASLAVDAGLVGLLLAALLLLANPFPRWVAQPAMGASLSLAQVMAYRGGSLLVGLLLLASVLALGFARLRARINRIERWQKDLCPVCGSDDLRRVHRRWYQHLPSWLGIPVRRYVCGNCQWRGARIDRRQL